MAPANKPSVRAYIDGIDCTGPPPIIPPDTGLSYFSVSIVPAKLIPGCGEPGVSVSFTVNGQRTNETAVWQPVGEHESRYSRIDLTVGPSFAYFFPSIADRDASGAELFTYRSKVIALIDGQVCGIGNSDGFQTAIVIVPSVQTTPGCGYEGAVVSFAVDGYAATETAVWRPGAGNDLKLHIVRSPETPLAGPSFAYYEVDVPALPPDFVGQKAQAVSARIGGVSCGTSASVAGPATVEVAVAPREVVPGCGYEGATVDFVAGILNTPIEETADWRPGWHTLDAGVTAEATPVAEPGGDVVDAKATVTPAISGHITPPGTGDAGLAVGR